MAAHLFRRGVGGDVEILGFGADQQVAHGAADDKGLVAMLLQVSQTRRLPLLMRSRVMPWLETGMTAGSWWLALGFLPLKTREMNLRITYYRSMSACSAAEKGGILPQSDDFPAQAD
jgi:hypothetical protein